MGGLSHWTVWLNGRFGLLGGWAHSAVSLVAQFGASILSSQLDGFIFSTIWLVRRFAPMQWVVWLVGQFCLLGRLARWALSNGQLGSRGSFACWVVLLVEQ